jgi:hypothetical protein
MLRIIEGKETLPEFLIGIQVAGIKDTVRLRSQNSAQVGFLMIAQGGDERVHCVLHRREAALRGG